MREAGSKKSVNPVACLANPMCRWRPTHAAEGSGRPGDPAAAWIGGAGVLTVVEASKQDEIRELARRVLPTMKAVLAGLAQVAIVDCASQIGSGALPIDTLPSAAIALTPPQAGKGNGRWLKAIAETFRSLPTPVIGRVTDNAFLLNLRTLEDETAFITQLEMMRR